MNILSLHLADLDRPGGQVPVRLRARRPQPPRVDPLGGQARRLRLRRLPGAPGHAKRRAQRHSARSCPGTPRYDCSVADASDESLALPRARRHPRRPAARVGALDRAGRRVRGAGRAVRLRPGDHADLRALRGVRTGRRESTDVVRKEMYDFEDKGGRRIALRPEGTAGVARAFAQHNPAVPWKVWYVAPHFRYERPQKGRNRQHWQVGVEALGRRRPRARRRGHRARPRLLPRRSGCATSRLSINSMGDEADRAAYVDVLRELPARARRRARRRLPRAGRGQPAAGARLEGPRLAGRDRARAADHRAPRRRGADALRGGAARSRPARHRATRSTRGSCAGSTTTRAPRSSSAASALDAAQNGIGGGGRYDKLAEQMGGQPTPGIGFGIGIERVLIACAAEGVDPRRRHPWPTSFVVDGLGRPERGHAARHRAPRGRHARRARLRRPLGQGADGRWPTGRAPRSG